MDSFKITNCADDVQMLTLDCNGAKFHCGLYGKYQDITPDEIEIAKEALRVYAHKHWAERGWIANG